VSDAPVACPCGARFQVSASFKAGLVNCPECGKATSVPGGPEPLFLGILAVLVVSVLAVSGALWAFVGSVAGGIALGVGVVVVAAIVLAS
jgi:hypothetical protein